MVRPGGRRYWCCGGVRLPLQVNRTLFGVFWVYRRVRGALSGPVLSTALGLAQTAGAVVLTDIAKLSGEQLTTQFLDSVSGGVVIDQAVGVIAEQRHIEINEAFVVLRATAFAQSRSSRAVAEDVVAHRLVFTPDTYQ